MRSQYETKRLIAACAVFVGCGLGLRSVVSRVDKNGGQREMLQGCRERKRLDGNVSGLQHFTALHCPEIARTVLVLAQDEVVRRIGCCCRSTQVYGTERTVGGAMQLIY